MFKYFSIFQRKQAFISGYWGRLLTKIGHLTFVLIVAFTLAFAMLQRAQAAAQTCDEVGLDAAIAAGGSHTFDCPGPGNVFITTDTKIIPSGRSVTLDGGFLNINGGNAHNIFIIEAGASLTLENISIIGGNAANGGGIVNYGTLTITNSAITGHWSDFKGGAIFNAGTLTISDSNISGNSAGISGGAIFNDVGGTVQISNTTISQNTVVQQGGGIYNLGILEIDTNSTISDNFAQVDGGGIYNDNGSNLAITNTTISHNKANFSGGGIYSQTNSVSEITSSTVMDNLATTFLGGGIFNDGSLTIDNTSFTGNLGYRGGGIANGFRGIAIVDNSELITNGANVDGGAVFNFGSLTVINCYIYNNQAGTGGGVVNASFGTTTISQSTLSNNSATSGGAGGFFNESGTAIVSDSTVDHNSATDRGGGIVNGLYGTIKIIYSTLFENTSNLTGGGLFNIGTVTLDNSTISSNLAADSGGGIFNESDGTMEINTSTLWGNGAYLDGGGIFNRGIMTINSSIVANSTGGDCTGIGAYTAANNRATGACGSLGVTGLDPVLKDNGGPTWTHALLNGSNAIDAASTCPPPTTDQRGQLRPQGSACDIGAYESPFTANLPPSAIAGGPYTVGEGASLLLNGSGTDPEGRPLTFTWDLNNDGIFEASGQAPIFSAAGRDGPDSQAVVLRVCDDTATCVTDTMIVNILNTAPTATFAVTASLVIEGHSTSLAFGQLFDPSPADLVAGLRYSYDCTNDGSFEVSESGVPSYDCNYPTSGSFTARGRIEDKDGGFTDYEVVVNVVTPQQAIAGPSGLISNVNKLVTSKVLNQGQGKALTSKLEAVIKQLDKSKNVVAANQLRAFINQVNALVNSGRLSPDEAAPLIELAYVVGEDTNQPFFLNTTGGYLPSPFNSVHGKK